ncbi:MAG: hypothetical protein IKQ43_09355, partial [Treponema sp.]|nr:hypothetical protein [Treponema sp.]
LSTNFGLKRGVNWDYRWYERTAGEGGDGDNSNGGSGGLTYTAGAGAGAQYNPANQYRHYYEAFDFYAGLRGKYQFSKAFSTDIALKGVADFKPRQSTTTTGLTPWNTVGVNPNVDPNNLPYEGRGVVFETIPTVQYHVGKHTFSFGVDLVFADPFVTLSFPTSWTYKF